MGSPDVSVTPECSENHSLLLKSKFHGGMPVSSARSQDEGSTHLGVGEEEHALLDFLDGFAKADAGCALFTSPNRQGDSIQ